MEGVGEGIVASITPIPGFVKEEEKDDEEEGEDEVVSPRESEAAQSESTHTAWDENNANPANAGIV